MPSRAGVTLALLLLLACSPFVPCAYSQQDVPVSRSYALPCAPQSFAVAADGTVAWLACEEEGKGALESDWVHRNWVYALDLATGRTRKISEGHGGVRFFASPRGAEAIMTRLGEMHAKRALLVNAQGVVEQLPIDSVIDWSPDGTRIYFEAGSTIQAEAWNILGILSVKDRSMQRVQLAFAAESLYVLPCTGALLFGDPDLDENGNLKFDAREFDPNGKLKGKLEAFPPGDFSANCRYVATEGFSHGPMPWEIVEVATGKRLAWFPVPNAADAAWQSFLQWNPRRENLYLRTTYTPVKGSQADVRTMLEIVSIADGHVLAEFPQFGGTVAWSADGESLLMAKGKQLEVMPLTNGS